jgi:hypothetical protein
VPRDHHRARDFGAILAEIDAQRWRRSYNWTIASFSFTLAVLGIVLAIAKRVIV